jgi:sulfopyruvate decarboxylase subunit beta
MTSEPVSSDNHPPRRMTTTAALQVLHERRQEHFIVVTNQRSARDWPRLSQHALDFNYNPSAMGGAIPLALGLAVAQPHREVIVVSGDGSLLMSLGCLITLADSGAENLTVLLLDNGVYEVTGGQQLPAGRPFTDYGGLARAAGWPTVVRCDSEAEWRGAAARVLASPGPRFVWLPVAPESGNLLVGPQTPVHEQATRLAQAIARKQGLPDA